MITLNQIQTILSYLDDKSKSKYYFHRFEFYDDFSGRIMYGDENTSIFVFDNIKELKDYIKKMVEEIYAI